MVTRDGVSPRPYGTVFGATPEDVPAVFRAAVFGQYLAHERVATGAAGAGHPGIRSDYTVIVLGVILLIIGFVVGIPVLWTIGIILALAGVALAVIGGAGRRIGGRAHWY